MRREHHQGGLPYPASGAVQRGGGSGAHRRGIRHREGGCLRVRCQSVPAGLRLRRHRAPAPDRPGVQRGGHRGQAGGRRTGRGGQGGGEEARDAQDHAGRFRHPVQGARQAEEAGQG